MTNLGKLSTSKETTVKYGELEVLPGAGVVMTNCTPGSAEVDAKMQTELENKRGFLQDVINKNLKQTALLLDSQECCEEILTKKAQSLMTSTCGMAEKWSVVHEHMKFYRIGQGIDITTLDLEPNKRDHSLFVDQHIKADGVRLDIRMP